MWNEDFRKQMVDQCGLCYIDWTLCHFLVSSTSVRLVLVINWTTVCIVLYCCVQYVKINSKQRAFAESINFLFSFEENWCLIISITSRIIWWPCFIARYVWTMVLACQKRWILMLHTWNMEYCQKIWASLGDS